MTAAEPSAGRATDALLIVALSLLAVAGAFTAPFLAYDDTVHITQNDALDPKVPLFSYFAPGATESAAGSQAYMPLTYLSWRLDRFLYADWMPASLGSWAPGVRFTTWLLHALAALLLWRFLLALGVTRGAALGIAALFACHPTACETLCWATERKTAIAGCFGFAALCAWTQRGWPRPARVAVATACYVLALMGKQSALGLLPVFAVLEGFGGAEGLRGEGVKAQPHRHAAALAFSLAPLAAASAFFILIGLRGHAHYLVPPPGGSLFTALLTDAWIELRQVRNLLVPTDLSASYAIEPIVSLADGRLWLSLVLLAAAVAATIYFARSRARAVFGWLWFFGAQGPSLNLIALSCPMADRYLYLALPGFFLAFAEMLEGLWARAQAAGGRRRLGLAGCAGLYVLLCGGLAVSRGLAWRDMHTLFADAARKEPRSAYARYGLGQAEAQAWIDHARDGYTGASFAVADGRMPVGLAYAEWLRRNGDTANADARNAAEAHADAWAAEWTAFFDEGVDADRQLKRGEVALELGVYHRLRGELAEAKRFLNLAAHPPPGVYEAPGIAQEARRQLGELGVPADLITP